jgi:hypothetical protein
MAEGLILEFDGVGRAQYEAVNARLGIDIESGQGDWPAGLVFPCRRREAGRVGRL